MNHILSIIIRWIAVIALIFPASPVFAGAISAHSGDEVQQDKPQLAVFGAPLSQRIGAGLREISPPLPLLQDNLATSTPALSARSVSLAAPAMPLPGNLTLSLPPALKNADFAANKSPASVQTSEQATNAPLLWPALSARGASVGPNPAAGSSPSADLSTMTDEQGHYRFENLEKGTHKVTLDLSTLPTKLQPVADEASPVLWLNPGQEMTSEPSSTGVRFTAAYDRETGDISGVVFWDQNGDGLQGSDEPGLAGVRVIDPTVHQYFVPFNDQNLWTLFDEKNRCHGDVVNVIAPINSFTYLTAGSDGTIYYYDHWEDGYDADPLNPDAASTTEVGALDAGATQIFQDNISPTLIGTLVGGRYYYDGRDRITVFGENATAVRLAYPDQVVDSGGQNSGVIAAAAWEIPEVADWGTEYIATVGEDLDFTSNYTEDLLRRFGGNCRAGWYLYLLQRSSGSSKSQCRRHLFCRWRK